MRTKADEAEELFNNGFNCAQAVLSSHCEDFGLDGETAKKLACAFGGGMGHIDEACGAFTGALMLIGLKYGQYKEADMESREQTYKTVKDFTRKFKAEFGTIYCARLIKYNLSDDEELRKARESGVIKKTCPAFVRRAVSMVEEYLA
ncbi:MAG: C-GCAxxG-C-C family protein [Treponemataceae bacterium]|nr:MAG: C-GCAxxG-C-C family protein [Treponemataceae bacterium]